MEEISKFVIFLSQFDISNSKMEKILAEIDSQKPFKSFLKGKFVENKILKPELFEKMKDYCQVENVDKFLTTLEDRKIGITTIYDENYPQKLIDLPDRPHILYYVGDLSLADRPSLSVVGTRKPSNYGIISTQKIVGEVAACGVVIVSGLAYGIDSIAHRKCLEVGGKTIAILGGGFDNIFPAEHIGLAREIAEKGLLLSEYRPKTPVTKYAFPLRNRIIAGLGEGVFIAEATKKSGTIHTKEYALEYGKNVYALPGQIDNPNAALPNSIIKTGQASLVTQGDDILKDYDIKREKAKAEQLDFSLLSEEERLICEALKDGMKSIEELTNLIDLDINIFNTCLTTLEINEIIKRMPGGIIALNS